jgi:hypothetical protein
MSELIQGCTNPAASNYNPDAQQEDNSCYYILRHAGQCYRFEDAPPQPEQSFTLSFALQGNTWVFYHDYLPDYYIHTRESLYSIKDNRIYKHNEGAPGVYYDETIKPFFIDLVFRANTDFITETVNWITELLSGRTESLFDTITHVTLWNSYQHSGRLTLSQFFESLQYTNIRRTKGEWSFNDFLNILKENPGEFLSSVFNDFLLNTGSIDTAMAWYDKAQLQDRWVCVRLENDNTSGKTLLLHEANITALKSDR